MMNLANNTGLPGFQTMMKCGTRHLPVVFGLASKGMNVRTDLLFLIIGVF